MDFKGEKMKNIGFLLLALVVFPVILSADVTPGAPAAKNILVMYDNTYPFANVVNELRNNTSSCSFGTGPSNNVTVLIYNNDDSQWPADFSTACGGGPCDQVWDLRWGVSGSETYTLNAARRTQLENFMAAGGSVMIQSENGGWFKPGVDELARDVLISGTYNTTGPQTGGGGDMCILNAAACTSAEDFANDYLNLASYSGGVFNTEFPGGVLVGELGGAQPVITNPTGTFAVGVAFTQASLKAPYNNGKMFVWYDYQAFTLHTACAGYANRYLAKNIMDFLVTGAPVPTATYTETASPTNTYTSTYTMTPTYTFTITNTFTPTSTFTSTLTFTNTSTPTITPTPTPPFEFEHKTSYPNPFKDSTNILYYVNRDSKVTVKVFTVSGEKIATLTQDAVTGYNRLLWNGTNDSNNKASSGVYLYSIQAVSGSDRSKLIWSKLTILR